MCTRLIIEGNSVYEIDEDCLACSREPETGAHRGEMPCLLKTYDSEDRKAAEREEEKRDDVFSGSAPRLFLQASGGPQRSLHFK